MPPVSCSLELPETVDQPHQPPAPTRSSGRKSWGVEIEEPGSTRPAEVLAVTDKSAVSDKIGGQTDRQTAHKHAPARALPKYVPSVASL